MEIKFQKYKRKSWIEMRPYIFGEDTKGISISQEDIKYGLADRPLTITTVSPQKTSRKL